MFFFSNRVTVDSTWKNTRSFFQKCGKTCLLELKDNHLSVGGKFWIFHSTKINGNLKRNLFTYEWVR